MSSRACDISSRCFFLVRLRKVALRSSTLPLRAREFSRLTEGDFLGTRGTPRVVPILILSNKPAYSMSAPKTNRTHTMTQASIAAKQKKVQYVMTYYTPPYASIKVLSLLITNRVSVVNLVTYLKRAHQMRWFIAENQD